MIRHNDLYDAVAEELLRYAGNIDERMAEIIIERNRAERKTWTIPWREAMSGGGLGRYEAEVRRQAAEMIGGGA